MSAQVTEAHKQLVATIVEQAFRFAEGNHKITPLSQLIADSEARACAELRADRDYNHECINRLASATGTLGEKSGRVVEVALSTIARAERAEAELAKAKAILASIEEDGTEEHNAAVRLRQELATERARLDYMSNCGFEHLHNETGDHLGHEWTISSYGGSRDVTLRDVIDAEMKEETK